MNTLRLQKKKKKKQRHLAALTLQLDLCCSLKYLQAIEAQAFKITPKPIDPHRSTHDSPI